MRWRFALLRVALPRQPAGSERPRRRTCVCTFHTRVSAFAPNTPRRARRDEVCPHPETIFFFRVTRRAPTALRVPRHQDGVFHRASPRASRPRVRERHLTAGHHAVPMPLVFLLFLLPLPTRFHERSDQLKRRAQLADARPLPRTPRRSEGTRTRMDGQAGEPGSEGPPTARGRPPPNQTTANDNPNTSSPRWEAWVPKP